MTKSNKNINDGLFHNKDGSVSDRLVLASFIIGILLATSMIIALHWSFKKQPLPEYALKIITTCTYFYIPLVGSLLGLQSYENKTFIKHNSKIVNEENNESNENN